MIFAVILAIAYIVFAIVCAKNESRLSGLYKNIGLFGRIKAFFTFDFTVAGFAAIIVGLVLICVSLFSENPPVGTSEAASILVAGVVLLPIGLLMLRSILKRCAPEARGRVIRDIIFISLGLCFKIGFFFLAFIFNIFALTAPKKMVLEDGREVYVDGTTVYDNNMRKIGTYDPATEMATVEKQ